MVDVPVHESMYNLNTSVYTKVRQDAKAAQDARDAQESQAEASPALVSVTPNRGKLLLRLIQPEEKVGSIFIPDSGAEKPQRGVIVGIGPNQVTTTGYLVPNMFRVGDEVWFTKYSGQEVEVEGDKLMVLSMDEVLCVIQTRNIPAPEVVEEAKVDSAS